MYIDVHSYKLYHVISLYSCSLCYVISIYLSLSMYIYILDIYIYIFIYLFILYIDTVWYTEHVLFHVFRQPGMDLPAEPEARERVELLGQTQGALQCLGPVNLRYIFNRWKMEKLEHQHFE